MGGEDGVNCEIGEDLSQSSRTVTCAQLVNGGLERFAKRLRSMVALAYDAGAMVFFREVDEMEIARESPCHLLCALERPGGNQLLDVALVPTVISRADHVPPEQLDVAQQFGAPVIGDDLPKHVPEQANVAP
jgi:hypothetical protein